MISSIDYPQYIGGTDQDDIDRAFSRIMKALISRDAQFLFGAGMSKASGVPIGSDLVNELLKLFFPDTGTSPPTEERLEELAREFPFEVTVEAIEKNIGKTRDDLTIALKEIFHNSSYQPSQAHHDFLSICYWEGTQMLDHIFTTNFDSLLEQVIGSSRTVAITENNSKEINKARHDGKIPLIYLHGKLDEEYQITESDMFGKEHHILPNMLRSALIEADAFVFVGYSMNDPDFRQVYMSYRNYIMDRKRSEKKTYLVSPAKDEFSYRLGKKIWKVRGAEWIPLDAEIFFSKLKRIMETHAEKEAREKVMEKYNIKDQNTLDDYIQQTADILGITTYDALQFLIEARSRVGGAK